MKQKKTQKATTKAVMMTTDNIKSLDKLNEEQSAQIQQKIFEFLAKQIVLYTVGDSSSVTTDTAKLLLTSITFTLEQALEADNKTHGYLLNTEIEDVYNKGQKVLLEKIDEGKSLLELMKQIAPSYANEYYWATYRGIKSFFAKYNPLFLAHEIPGEIDYPLCVSVPEVQMGIEYINDYLKRIFFENHILSMFNSDLVDRLLKKAYMDFSSLPVNLCEQVIINTSGLAFLGKDVFELSVSAKSLSKIKAIASSMSHSELKQAIEIAAETLCVSLSILEQSQIDYVTATAISIVPRLKEAIISDSVSMIFIDIGR